MEEVIHLISEKKLFLLADEVNASEFYLLSKHAMNQWGFFVVILLRCIRTVFMGKTLSLSPIKGFWLSWGLLCQTPWNWRPSTQHPKASWGSEFYLSCVNRF